MVQQSHRTPHSVEVLESRTGAYGVQVADSLTSRASLCY